jgi:hypothetical protein
MSTEVAKLELEVKQDPMASMQAHLDHLFREVSLLREEVRTSVNSRRGLPGIQGAKGDPGEPARPADIRIVQADGKIKVIDGGVVKAEIVAVAGPAGRNGVDGKSVKGDKGDSGVSPSIDAIVAEVVKVLEARLLKR